MTRVVLFFLIHKWIRYESGHYLRHAIVWDIDMTWNFTETLSVTSIFTTLSIFLHVQSSIIPIISNIHQTILFKPCWSAEKRAATFNSCSVSNFIIVPVSCSYPMKFTSAKIGERYFMAGWVASSLFKKRVEKKNILKIRAQKIEP